METTSSEAPVAAPAASRRSSSATPPGWSRAGPASTHSATRSWRSTSSRSACSTAWRCSAMCRTASPVLSILIAAVAMTFLAIAYAGLIAVMPRAGGDYVWQTPRPRRAARDRRWRGRRRDRALSSSRTPSGSATRSRSAPAAVGARRRRALGRLRGGIGFVLAATGWWFILAMWAPIYGAILKLEFFQPLAAARLDRGRRPSSGRQRDARRLDHRRSP